MDKKYIMLSNRPKPICHLELESEDLLEENCESTPQPSTSKIWIFFTLANVAIFTITLITAVLQSRSFNEKNAMLKKVSLWCKFNFQNSALRPLDTDLILL